MPVTRSRSSEESVDRDVLFNVEQSSPLSPALQALRDALQPSQESHIDPPSQLFEVPSSLDRRLSLESAKVSEASRCQTAQTSTLSPEALLARVDAEVRAAEIRRSQWRRVDYLTPSIVPETPAGVSYASLIATLRTSPGPILVAATPDSLASNQSFQSYTPLASTSSTSPATSTARRISGEYLRAKFEPPPPRSPAQSQTLKNIDNHTSSVQDDIESESAEQQSNTRSNRPPLPRRPVTAPPNNQIVLDYLRQRAAVFARSNVTADKFRATALKKAIQSIEQADFVLDSGESALALPHVGSKTASLIDDALAAYHLFAEDDAENSTVLSRSPHVNSQSSPPLSPITAPHFQRPYNTSPGRKRPRSPRPSLSSDSQSSIDASQRAQPRVSFYGDQPSFDVESIDHSFL